MTLHIHPAGHGYGWRPGLPTHRFGALRFNTVDPAALPKAVDLRQQCPPVYDQGQLGSCTANAWGGMLEFLQMKAAQAAVTPSRLLIYYDERALEGDTADDTGASLTDGATVLSKDGAPPESEWPYDVAKFADAPPSSAIADALQHKILDPHQVAQDLTTMKEVLASGYPMPIGFTVFESFESDAVTQTGIVPMPGANEQQVGGHAVLVVGYDDSKTMFIVRNSWGTDWGQAGYFEIPYAYLTNPQLSSDFWSATRAT